MAACGGATGSVPDAGEDGDAAAVRECRLTCSSTADCITPGADDAHDSDNYACTNGGCVYLGCKDGECAAASGAVCPPPVEGQPRLCTLACTKSSDCALIGIPFLDVDNWECITEACSYLGCLTDEECESVDANSGCAPFSLPGASVPLCTPRCGVADDCAQTPDGIFSASHWTCREGFCWWLGCFTTGDCSDADPPDEVCI